MTHWILVAQNWVYILVLSGTYLLTVSALVFFFPNTSFWTYLVFGGVVTGAGVWVQLKINEGDNE